MFTWWGGLISKNKFQSNVAYYGGKGVFHCITNLQKMQTHYCCWEYFFFFGAIGAEVYRLIALSIYILLSSFQNTCYTFLK